MNTPEFFHLLLSGLYRRSRNLTVSAFRLADFTAGGDFHPALKINYVYILISAWMDDSELVRRIAGEISDDAVRIFQIEHLENGVRGLAVLALDDRVCNAHLFGRHVVLKYGFTAQPYPSVFGTGHRKLHIGICLHIFVDILLVVCAEPQLAVHFTGKHKGTCLCLTVCANSGKILYRVCLQEFNNFLHFNTSIEM